MEVRTADPIANPFPVAAVVLPSASRVSVVSLTLSSRSAISAIPPALSAMGPYASVARVIPRVDSIPTAAMAIPYWPERALQPRMVKTRMNVGGTHEIMPIPRPWMMTVAGPVTPAAAMDLSTGGREDEVRFAGVLPLCASSLAVIQSHLTMGYS